MKLRRLAGALAALMLVAGSAWAKPTIYRCGPDGREYSQTPCKDGRAVETDDPRSAEQQRDGRAVAASQARLAKQLEAERRARETGARGDGAAGFKPSAAAEPASAAKGKKGRKKADGAASTAATAPKPPSKPPAN